MTNGAPDVLTEGAQQMSNDAGAPPERPGAEDTRSRRNWGQDLRDLLNRWLAGSEPLAYHTNRLGYLHQERAQARAAARKSGS